MKKLLIILSLFLIVLVSGCANVSTTTNTTENVTTDSTASLTNKETTTMKYYEANDNTEETVLKEIKACFEFFWDTQNTDETSKGYGLSPDRYTVSTGKVGTLASIASVGYCMAAYPIGVEHGWVTYSEAEERAYKVLCNIENLDRVMGFFYHFYGMKSGIKSNGSEVSIIDTALFLCGALACGQYFGGRVQEVANRIYEDVVWSFYYDFNTYQFYMGYDHTTGKFSGHWTAYAEQLIIFILAAGSPTHQIGRTPYTLMKSISRKSGDGSNYDSFYMTNNGSLFIFQYSHSFFDSGKYVDEDGYSWYTNSVNASKAAYAYAVSQSKNYLTFSATSWGLSACDGPNGYNGSYGSGPSSGPGHQVDGTVCLSAAPASIVFTKTESLNALEYYYSNSKLLCKYGLLDSYNLGTTSTYSNSSIDSLIPTGGWYAADLIGIDKGNELMMLENYHSSLIWNLYQSLSYVQNGLEVLGFTEVK